MLEDLVCQAVVDQRRLSESSVKDTEPHFAIFSRPPCLAFRVKQLDGLVSNGMLL